MVCRRTAMASATPTEPRSGAIGDPFISIDVPFEIARLQASGAYQTEGHSGRTLTKSPELRVVVEAMKAGVRLPLHEPAEQLTLQVVLGQLRVWMRHGENSELSEGGFVAIDAGRVHELEALQDCAFLLTLAWPPVERRAAGGH
jgi:quercetin dioxygenase-like cupin family protein